MRIFLCVSLCKIHSEVANLLVYYTYDDSMCTRLSGYCAQNMFLSSLWCYAEFIPQSTITENMAAVHFPSNALRSKIFKKANGSLLKDRHKTGGRFV